MKSHFIEGSNKQYSIRKDGFIVRHYVNTKYKSKSYKDKMLCVHNGLSTIYINKIKTTVAINILLFEYFNFRYCTQCNNKIYLNNIIVCINCKKENIKIADKKHYHNNKLKHKQSTQKQRDKLSNWYIANIMRINLSIIPEELITAKREQLLLYRQLKSIKNENRIEPNHNNTIRYDERS